MSLVCYTFEETPGTLPTVLRDVKTQLREVDRLERPKKHYGEGDDDLCIKPSEMLDWLSQKWDSALPPGAAPSSLWFLTPQQRGVWTRHDSALENTYSEYHACDEVVLFAAGYQADDEEGCEHPVEEQVYENAKKEHEIDVLSM